MKANAVADRAGGLTFPPGLTVGGALLEGSQYLARHGIDSPRLDAEVLLAAVMGENRAGLYSRFDRELSVRERALFVEALGRRSLREPVAYILGVREFWSLDFAVSSPVLIPRPETEVLVEVSLGLLRAVTRPRGQAGVKILELGTGSGAIAVCLAKERDDAEIWATDISVAALEVARQNALRHGVQLRTHLVAADLFVAFNECRAAFDLIVSNPPYVKRDAIDDLAAEIKDWEPRAALDGGSDGFDFYRRMIPEAHQYLRAGGAVAVEVGAGMAREVSAMFAGVGRYSPCAAHRDYAGSERVVVARALA